MRTGARTILFLTAHVFVLSCAGARTANRGAARTAPVVQNVLLGDFLSGHSSTRGLVKIEVVPATVYLERGRDAVHLDFDFRITGLSDRRLVLRFVKVAVLDSAGRLVTYRHANHNGMNAGIRTLGKWTVEGKETFDLYNPFHSFPARLAVARLRYMFTFKDAKTGEELYHGDVQVRPVAYRQQTRLRLPLKGLLTVLDGHDYLSHHRRFSGAVMGKFTAGQLAQNFARHSIDLVVVGDNGHLRDLPSALLSKSYDFHITDARAFHTHGAEVLAPADGVVVDVVNDLPDLYDKPFDMGGAIRRGRLKDLGGNLVVIRHRGAEHSHLFHLLRGSVTVKKGQRVKQGQVVGKVGFSGAATTYVHLHYQLMDGPHPLRSNPLPILFDDVIFQEGSRIRRPGRAMVDTGDFLVN